MYLIFLQPIGNYTYILLYAMFSLIYDFMYFRNVFHYLLDIYHERFNDLFLR